MITLWIHWFFASVFVGGMAFHLWVYKSEPFPASDDEGIRWNHSLHKRSRSFRWICLLVLLGTGILNLINGELAARVSTSYGGWLLAKLFLVAVLFGMTGIYDYGFGRGRSKKSKEEGLKEESPLKKAFAYGILAIAGGILLITLNF